MIIIGVLLIVAVLLDGYRRVRSERSNRIRVTLTRQALNRASNSSPVEAERSGEPNPELPNGGARVIFKQQRTDVDLDQSVPVLMESVHIAPDPVEQVAPPVERSFEAVDAEPLMADEPVEAVDAAPAAMHERIEPRFEETEQAFVADDPVVVESSRFSQAEIDAQAKAVAMEPAQADAPAVQDEVGAGGTEAAAKTYSAIRSRSFGDDSLSTSRPNSAAQEVLIVNVLSKDKAGFKGQDVLQILLACDLRFGNMNIFHRYEKANGKGAVQFSVANLVEPGTFDLDRIESFTTPGLCFFLALPGPEKAITAFNYMVETAQVLVKNLNGELRDEAHSVMTQQTIEHCRQRIRDFERKQLTLQL
jgi:cell division protein ZipA